MAMYTLYCDDSGTHEQSEVVVAACLISTIDRWDNFLSEWCKASRDEEFGVFHMADFEGNHPPFGASEWRDTIKRKRTLERLISIIRDSVMMGYAVGIVKKDYDAVVSKTIRDKFGLGKNHYTFAVRSMIGRIHKWRAENHITQPMNYVFDRMSKGKGEIIKQFDTPIRHPEHGLRDFGMFNGCYSFADKAYIVPLQGADICAWEALRYMTNVAMRPPEKRQSVRDSYSRLYQPPIRVQWHNKDSLGQMVKTVKNHTWSFGS
jgi:hypothetical protein